MIRGRILFPFGVCVCVCVCVRMMACVGHGYSGYGQDRVRSRREKHIPTTHAQQGNIEWLK